MTLQSIIHEEVKNKFMNQQVSYVLITCQEPKVDGSMGVEMSFNGNPELIEYLLGSAQDYLIETD